MSHKDLINKVRDIVDNYTIPDGQKRYLLSILLEQSVYYLQQEKIVASQSVIKETLK